MLQSIRPFFEAKLTEAPWQVATKPIEQPKARGWGDPYQPSQQEPYKPSWHASDEVKVAFATHLAKGQKPLDAALIASKEDMPGSLWAVQHWIRDPLVLETREKIENAVNLLDKDALSVKLLKMADEKVDGRFIHELKDRTALLKLYAEIQGHIGKVNLDLSNKTFVNNEMKITFVEAEQEKQEIKTIEHNVIENENEDLQIDLKLVG